ncbi:MAG: hypothetical protein RL238_643, partial [Actinomycetota bacterium]
ALDSQQLPKLMDRPMSMVEITAAHAVITGDTPPPLEESKYTPVAVEGLPTLQGFAPLAAATATVVEEPPTEVEALTADEEAPPAPAMAPTTPAAHDGMHIPSFEALLDTPITDWSTPAQPPAVQEIWDMVDDLLGLPHHDVAPAAPPAPTAAEPPPAAPDRPDEATDDDTTEPKRRTWMRSRKG